MPTIQELGQKVKAKYPKVYDDLSDYDLGVKVKSKYPGAYNDFVDEPQTTLQKAVALGDQTSMFTSGGALNKIKEPLTNIGTGIGSAIGKTVVGAFQAPMAGASAYGKKLGIDTQSLDTAIGRLESLKQGVYQKPFEDRLAAPTGKVGTAIGTVAPYFIGGGIVNPATAGLNPATRVATRAATDVAISQAQTGGDAKAGLATGVTSAVADTLLGGKLKPVKGLLPSAKQFGKTASVGYVSDVSSGLAGQRGEDRTGAKAFIPGAGTALSTLLGGGQAVSSFVKNVKNPPEEVINAAKLDLEDKYNELYSGTKSGKAKLSRAEYATELKNKSGTSGFAPTTILAQDGVIPKQKGSVLDTFEQANEYKQKVFETQKLLKNAIKEVEYQTPKVSLADLEQEAINRAATPENIDSGDAQDIIKSIRKEFAKLRASYGNEILLSKVDDIKSARWGKIDFTKQNPFAPRADKLAADADYLIAKSAQKKIEDVAASAGLEDVAQFNRDIGDRLEAARFLAGLNGNKVKGGRLLKYTAMVIGSSAGNSLPSKVLGALGGDMVANMLISNSVTSAQKRLILRNLQRKDPASYTKVMEWLTKQGVDRQLRPALPEARSIFVEPTNRPANFQTGIKPNIPSGANTDFSVEDIRQTSSLPKARSIPTAINTANTVSNISPTIQVPKGSSIDQTRRIVNNHLETTLQAIADPDTFDMISANPSAFYRQQLDDISMGLKAENPKYARLANSISSIDVDKIDSFETLAKMIRDKVNQKSLVESLSGKGIPNRQGGFIKNPLMDESSKYLYHGTSEQAFEKIKNEGIVPQRRGVSSLSKTEEYSKNWADNPYTNTKGVMLRVKKDLVKTIPSKSTVPSDSLNELLTKDIIKPKDIEIFKDGKWKPLILETPDPSLIQEAKKYKSADDFIKAQGEYYHGTSNPIEGKLGDKTSGIWLAENPDIASKYIGDGLMGSKGEIYYIKPNTKLNLKDIYDKGEFTNFNELTPAMESKLIADGYDGIRLNDAVRFEKGTKEYGYYMDKTYHPSVRVFNKSKGKLDIVSKSELISIWKQANKK